LSGDPQLNIRPATNDDLPHLVAILSEAAQWLIDRGQALWTLEQFTVEKLQPSVTAGDWHIAWVESNPVAVVSLTFEDKLFWPEIPPGDSIFIHRLAVVRKYAGTGVPAAIFSYAENLGRQKDLRHIRLDCAARANLCHVYESAGFSRIDERHMGSFTVVRFKRAIPYHPGS
jgi:GNAT superfamily N-acetyltransferase